ncbi:MAG TPA: iron ABC transporter substrate-binding protein [Stellaceae bacterium]|jgi:iron complex transport system substrate-binding protein|nr:iron ABC transporter substrate-binding protein [Stellaceae bacterium]
MLSRRDALSLIAGTAVTLGAGRVLAQTRTVTDSAGRKVAIPAKIDKVFAAGTPAAITLYTLVPDRLAGWPQPIREEARAYLPAKYAALPVTGRLTGRANTANVEAVLASKPDLIIDIGTIAPIYASLADRVQQQTGIPYLLLDGALARTPALYRQLGAILGAGTAAESLATYAADQLALVKARIAYVPPGQRARVYYARGPEGLETGLAGSINAEMLDFVGATNVAATGEKRNIATVSAEQILIWNPEDVVTIDQRFYHGVWTDPIWEEVQAVREKRVFLAPNKPFGWFDSPPAANRLIGLKWLCNKLYRGLFTGDLAAETRDFYRRFYHVELTQAQLTALLEPAA